MATGEGSSTGWTASAGNKHECIDENIYYYANEDTDYISRADSEAAQGFTFTAFSLPTGATPYSVDVYERSRCLTGNTGVKPVPLLRVGGTNYDTSTTLAELLDYYTQAWVRWLTNPATSSAWTKAQVEGTDGTNPLQQFGINCVVGSGETIRTTQLWVRVIFDVAYTTDIDGDTVGVGGRYDIGADYIYTSGTMQYGRPTSVVTQGSWTPSAGTIPECLD